MRTSRNLACALLASTVTFIGLTAQLTPAEAATTVSTSSSTTAAPAPTAAPKPKPKPKLTRAEKVIKWASKQKGDPYRYGANGPKAFDCSGLVQYVYKKSGKKIGRTSGAQLKGKHIAKSKKKKGDILIFISNGRAYHSAIYAGKGKMWEAQRSGTKVGKHKIWSSGYVVRRPK